MSLVSDLFLVAGALAAGFYCYILSRRLSALTDAESGVGKVVGTLSKQVDDLNNSIQIACTEADASSSALTELTLRAEGVAQRLELMVASMHDIPEPKDEMVLQTKARTEGPVFSTRIKAEKTGFQ
ncbi:hypothetical protein [Planktotalea sp.]|uniref:hypothetical protein n=1 Tax=Planktotalea sp. TaxID=2029877 RepID=UPI003F6D3950